MERKKMKTREPTRTQDVIRNLLEGNTGPSAHYHIKTRLGSSLESRGDRSMLVPYEIQAMVMGVMTVVADVQTTKCLTTRMNGPCNWIVKTLSLHCEYVMNDTTNSCLHGNKQAVK